MPIDATTLANLIEAHAGALSLWLRSRCDSPDDVTQEAFCRLAVREPPPDNQVAWLYRVARDLAGKQRRSDERREKRERAWAQRESSSEDPLDTLEAAETMQAVQELDQESRDVLVARIWGQMSLEEIGKLLDISTTTVFRRYEAALRTLRAKLEPKRMDRR